MQHVQAPSDIAESGGDPPPAGGAGNRGAAHASLCKGREHGGTRAARRRKGRRGRPGGRGQTCDFRALL